MALLAGIVGYSGYSGAELLHILERHPHVEPILLEHRDDGAANPPIRNARQPHRIPSTPEAVRNEGLGVVFLATPPEVSMELTSFFLDAGARVIDLSGAFRLGTPENYLTWYKA